MSWMCFWGSAARGDGGFGDCEDGSLSDDNGGFLPSLVRGGRSGAPRIQDVRHERVSQGAQHISMALGAHALSVPVRAAQRVGGTRSTKDRRRTSSGAAHRGHQRRCRVLRVQVGQQSEPRGVRGTPERTHRQARRVREGGRAAGVEIDGTAVRVRRVRLDVMTRKRVARPSSLPNQVGTRHAQRKE